MKRLMPWFRRALSARRPAPRRQARLALEQLETREVLSVSALAGAPLIPHVEVDTLFYGAQWQTDPTLQQQLMQIQSFFQSVTNSSYMDMLSEYSTAQYQIGRGSWEQGLYVPDQLPALLPDSQIQQMVAGLISQGWVAPPDGNRLYFVFTAPGVEVSTGNMTSGTEPNMSHFLGYHSAFTDPTTGTLAYYAVVPYVPAGPVTWGITDQVQSLTAVSSHELAEAVTDPDCRTGYRDRTQPGSPEIGDLAAGHFGVLNGYVVQAEWSNQINAIALPGDAQWGLPGGGGGGPGTPQRFFANLLQLANGLTHSAEYYQNLVAGVYQRYLGRAPEARETAAWVGLLQGGLSDEALEAGFIGSAEYIQDHGGDWAAWVQGMYQDLLGRTPASWEVDAWVNNLAAGEAPSQVAYGFAASAEREAQRVTTDYQTFLGRDPSMDEISAWVAAFVNGASNESIMGGFAGSPEYFQNSTKGNGDRTQWIQSAYQDVLHRSPAADEINTLLAEMD
jgi:hypothetical protein